MTGKEEDVEVGLQYFGKRFLNPLLGRWVSADPLAVHAPGEADLNLYAYVSGSVLKNVDPLGLQEEAAESSGEDAADPQAAEMEDQFLARIEQENAQDSFLKDYSEKGGVDEEFEQLRDEYELRKGALIEAERLGGDALQDMVDEIDGELTALGGADSLTNDSVHPLVKLFGLYHRRAMEVIHPNAASQSRVGLAFRTTAEQDHLYSLGRTTPNPNCSGGFGSGCIVTGAQGGWSNHNYGLAYDHDHFTDNGYNNNPLPYVLSAAVAADLDSDVEWGGWWTDDKTGKPKPDLPHFQLVHGQDIHEIRRKSAAGEDPLF